MTLESRSPGNARLDGLVCAVTGAGQGIGLAIARAFARQGAKLVVNDAREEAGVHAAASVGNAPLCVGDVSESSVAQKLVALALERYGKLDVLVNNAAIAGRASGDGPVTESSEDSWDRIMQVNLKSVFLCCRFAIPEMARGGGGSIINLSSVLALTGSSMFTSHAYIASKGAILGLTRAMAVHYAPRRIRVNALCPGFIETPSASKASERPGLLEYVAARQPLVGGLGPVEDIAATAVFLASPESAMITGTALPVDGGWSAGA